MSSSPKDPNPHGQPRPRRATRWAVAGFLLALAATLVMLLGPLNTQEETTTIPSSPSSGHTELVESKVTHPSLLETEGWSVALPLSVPVLLTVGGLMAARFGVRSVLVVAAVLLAAFVVLGALSVGIYYLPAEVAMIVAIGKEHR
jgi:MFS family permease